MHGERAVPRRAARQRRRGVPVGERRTVGTQRRAEVVDRQLPVAAVRHRPVGIAVLVEAQPVGQQQHQLAFRRQAAAVQQGLLADPSGAAPVDGRRRQVRGLHHEHADESPVPVGADVRPIGEQHRPRGLGVPAVGDRVPGLDRGVRVRADERAVGLAHVVPQPGGLQRHAIRHGPAAGARQLTTFATTGPDGPAALARFGRFFLGELWDVYARPDA